MEDGECFLVAERFDESEVRQVVGRTSEELKRRIVVRVYLVTSSPFAFNNNSCFGDWRQDFLHRCSYGYEGKQFEFFIRSICSPCQSLHCFFALVLFTPSWYFLVFTKRCFYRTPE